MAFLIDTVDGVPFGEVVGVQWNVETHEVVTTIRVPYPLTSMWTLCTQSEGCVFPATVRREDAWRA